MVISRTGKVLEKKKISQKFWKTVGNFLYSFVHLRSLIKRIHISINIYSFNQTIVSHSFVSFKVIYLCIHGGFTTCLVVEIWFKVLEIHCSTRV